MEINEILSGLNDPACGVESCNTSNNCFGNNWIQMILLLSLLGGNSNCLSNNNSCCCCEKPKFKKVKKVLYEPECCNGNLMLGSGSNSNMLLIFLLLSCMDK